MARIVYLPKYITINEQNENGIPTVSDAQTAGIYLNEIFRVSGTHRFFIYHKRDNSDTTGHVDALTGLSKNVTLNRNIGDNLHAGDIIERGTPTENIVEEILASQSTFQSRDAADRWVASDKSYFGALITVFENENGSAYNPNPEEGEEEVTQGVWNVYKVDPDLSGNKILTRINLGNLNYAEFRGYIPDISALPNPSNSNKGHVYIIDNTNNPDNGKKYICIKKNGASGYEWIPFSVGINEDTNGELWIDTQSRQLVQHRAELVRISSSTLTFSINNESIFYNDDGDDNIEPNIYTDGENLLFDKNGLEIRSNETLIINSSDNIYIADSDLGTNLYLNITENTPNKKYKVSLGGNGNINGVATNRTCTIVINKAVGPVLELFPTYESLQNNLENTSNSHVCLFSEDSGYFYIEIEHFDSNSTPFIKSITKRVVAST